MDKGLFIRLLIVSLVVASILACAVFIPTSPPIATSPATVVPTKIDTLTPTLVFSPEPTVTLTTTVTGTSSPVVTLEPVPTSSLQDPDAISMLAECRSSSDGINALKANLELPQDFNQLANPFHERRPEDFNPNSYFQILTHLHIKPGVTLDFVYFSDQLGGKPLLYARAANAAPFQTYVDLLAFYSEELSDEASLTQLPHSYDYLKSINVDRTPESYFQYMALALYGDQFYLFLSGNYNDQKLVCDSTDIRNISGDLENLNIKFPLEVSEGIGQLDLEPFVLMAEDTVTVRLVTFTKWGGFYEEVYVVDKEKPYHLQDVQHNHLLKFDSGIKP